MNYQKQKMCGNKANFRTLAAAERIGALHNQRAYECPVCFCFHLTSKDDWREEFIAVALHEVRVREARNEGRREAKPKITELNIKINELQLENKRLRLEIHALKQGRPTKCS